MKTRTCEVSAEYARVDIVVDGIMFRGAALHGAGGVMGEASKDGWRDIANRHRVLASRGEMVRIYTKLPIEGPREHHDVPARTMQLLAVYAPGYECTLVNPRSR